jgi:flagellar FliJ protein
MFRFSLEAVLNYRRVLEDRAARELRQVAEELEDARGLLARYRESREAHERHWLAAEQRGVGSVELSLFRVYAIRLREKISIQQQIVDEIAARHEKHRLELVERMRARRLLERLKEKRHQEYLLETYRRERRELDDLASQRRARQS